MLGENPFTDTSKKYWGVGGANNWGILAGKKGPVVGLRDGHRHAKASALARTYPPLLTRRDPSGPPLYKAFQLATPRGICCG